MTSGLGDYQQVGSGKGFNIKKKKRVVQKKPIDKEATPKSAKVKKVASVDSDELDEETLLEELKMMEGLNE